jgi:hypothetical protein
VLDVRPTRATALERLDLPGARFVVSVQEPATAATALAAATRRGELLSRKEGVAVVPDGIDFRAARAVVTHAAEGAPAGGWLRPEDVSALCAAAGLRRVDTIAVRTADQACRAARRIEGPVVVKGIVDDVVHKADAGLVRMPVADCAEVRRTVAEWSARWGDRWRGAVVQPLVAPGDELLVGGVRNATAGPVVALGAGGRAADALGHRVHRLAPLTPPEAEEMVRATGLFDTEHGRGLDRASVEDCLHRVGWLLEVLPELADVEINPLVVRGSGAEALDVRMRVTVGNR